MDLRASGGDNWVVVPADTSLTTSGIAPGDVAQVRVRANPAVVQDPKAEYKLTLGSAPHLNGFEVKGDNVVRVPNNVFWMARDTVMVVMPTRLAMSLMVTDFFLSIGKAAKGNPRRLACARSQGDSNQGVPALRPVTFGLDHFAQQPQRLLQHRRISRP